MKSYNYNLSYIDLLLNLFCTVLVLFLLTSLLIQPSKKVVQEGAKKDAELIIQMEWPPDRDCDVDIWTRDPAKHIASYQNKNVGLMNLERDDLGKRGDFILGPNGETVVNPKNEEVVSFRGLLPGTYTVNLHLYTCLTAENTHSVVGSVLTEPLPVNITIIKLNPQYKVVDNRIVNLVSVWEEKTVYSFTIDAAGNVSNFDDTPVRLIGPRDVP